MAEIPITAGGKDRVPLVSSIYRDAFRDDPVITYMLCNLSREERHAYLDDFFNRLLTAAALNDAIFEEAQEYSSASVLMPPGKRSDNIWTLIPAGLLGGIWTLGLRGCYRMFGEYVPLNDKTKVKGLKGEKNYYHVFFLATRPEYEGRGLCSALVRAAQERASKDGVPLWLEATTEKSATLYERLGFARVELMRLGKGTTGSDGTWQKGGQGVPVWAMVWWPPESA